MLYDSKSVGDAKFLQHSWQPRLIKMDVMQLAIGNRLCNTDLEDRFY